MKRPALGEGVKVKYSVTERGLYDLLPMGEKNKVSSADLAAKWYKDKVPYHGQSIIGSTVRSLSKKIDANREPIVVSKTKRAGPNPVEFWLENRS